MNVWSRRTWCRVPISFPQARNYVMQPRRFATSFDGSLLFLPCESALHVYGLGSGKLLHILKGHMDTVNGCVYSRMEGEAFSVGRDGQILGWGRGGDVRKVWEV